MQDLWNKALLSYNNNNDDFIQAPCKISIWHDNKCYDNVHQLWTIPNELAYKLLLFID